VPKKKTVPQARAVAAEDMAKQIVANLHYATNGDLEMSSAVLLIAAASLLHAAGLHKRAAAAAFKTAYEAVDPYLGQSEWIN